MNHVLRQGMVVVSLLTGIAWTAQAQELRDPTMAPAEAGVPGSSAAAASPPLGMDGMAVIVRNGSPYLVVGTRLYAPGQMVGKARLERISETEVWLREGVVLRKIPRFPGIQRTAAAVDCKPPQSPGATAAAPRSKRAKKSLATGARQAPKPAPSASPVAAPCAIAQP